LVFIAFDCLLYHELEDAKTKNCKLRKA